MSDEYTDVDTKHDSDNVSAAVELEGLEKAAVVPKPWYMTSQFVTMAVTWLVGFLVTFLVSKGLLTESTAPGFQEGLVAITIAVVGWVTSKYITGRNEVSAIKASGMVRLEQMKAEEAIDVARSARNPMGASVELRGEPGMAMPMGGWFNMGTVETALSFALMFMGSAKKGSKKEKAIKAIKAALAALREYNESGE